MKKIFIHPKDVAALRGQSVDTARKLFRTMRDAYGKKARKPITIKEYCDYENLDYSEIYFMINGCLPPKLRE